MSIRTSGYFKEKQVGGEILKNSDFENGLENWQNYGWKSVEWIADYNDEPAVKLTFYPTIDNFRYIGITEIDPEDLLMMTVSLKEVSNDNPVHFSLYFYDKYGYYRSKRSYEVRPKADTLYTVSKLFPISEAFIKVESERNSVRAVRPAIEAYQADGWSSDDVLYIKNISLRRVNPEWFRVFPVEIYKVYEPSGMTKDTYYSEEWCSGIFHSGEYNFNLSYIEETGGTDSITLSMKIQSYDYAGNRWYDAVVFDDVVVAAGTTVQNKVYTKIATAGLGIRQRAVMTLSGSGTVGPVVLTVSCTYKQ